METVCVWNHCDEDPNADTRQALKKTTLYWAYKKTPQSFKVQKLKLLVGRLHCGVSERQLHLRLRKRDDRAAGEGSPRTKTHNNNPQPSSNWNQLAASLYKPLMTSLATGAWWLPEPGSLHPLWGDQRTSCTQQKRTITSLHMLGGSGCYIQNSVTKQRTFPVLFALDIRKNTKEYFKKLGKGRL